MSKKSGLGRGLDALINSEPSTIVSNQETGRHDVAVPFSSINEVDIDLIEVNPFQPRREFNEDALGELSESIRQLGLIQPITVRKTGNKFQLISGERRFRASKRAGLMKIPAYVRDADDEQMLVLALVENVQREDLNAIDIATGYQQLIEEFRFTQEKLSDKIGKNRSTITNYMRLLKLPPEIQLGIKQNKISMGHARAILGAEDPQEQSKIFNKIVKEDLSVRKVEEIVRKINKPADVQEKTNHVDEQFMHEFEDTKGRLTGIFGEAVEFHKSQKGTGKIIISFKSDIELNHILSIIEQK